MSFRTASCSCGQLRIQVECENASHGALAFATASPASKGPAVSSPHWPASLLRFEARLAFSSAMEGVCSAQVQEQNKHSREAKGGREK
jgi:hypothetical protein